MRNTPNRGFVDLPPLASYTRPRPGKQRAEARMRVVVGGHTRNIGEISVAALNREEKACFSRGPSNPLSSESARFPRRIPQLPQTGRVANSMTEKRSTRVGTQ